MFTRCPYCHTYFKIHAEHIKKAGGKVRCGRCFKVFNSIGNLLEQLPVSLEERDQHIAANSTAAAAATAAPAASPAPTPTPPPAPAPAPAPPPAAAAVQEELERIDGIEVSPGEHRDLIIHPGITADTGKSSLLPSMLWASGILAMFFVFALQYSYFMRTELVKKAEFRPWLQWVCDVTGCKFPLVSDTLQVELAHRDIASHPKVKNALLITAVLINNATFAQPYPAMEIRLSDIAGRVVARRTFYPQEYLDANVDLREGMPPESPIQIALEIQDPGQNAVNFEFNFKEIR